MKVFISWSGELSGELGAKLRDWLPNVMQRVQPYFTPQDIDKGARWIEEITAELRESRFGIMCVTPDNMESSWIMFEAGAISATFEQNKICPILFGLEKDRLRGPLFQFQAINFNKDEIKALVVSINSDLGPERLSDGTLDRVFEKWWPELEQDINNVIKNWKPQRPPEKTDEERHVELLAILHQITEMRHAEIHKALSEDIFVNMYANIDAAIAAPTDEPGMLDALSMLARNLEFMQQRIFKKPEHLDRAALILDRIALEKKKRLT